MDTRGPTLVPFRGRSHLRVYIKDKPDHPNSCFAYHLKIYAGSRTLLPEQKSNYGSTCDIITSGGFQTTIRQHLSHRSLLYLPDISLQPQCGRSKDIAWQPREHPDECGERNNDCLLHAGSIVPLLLWLGGGRTGRFADHKFVSAIQGGTLDHVDRVLDKQGNRGHINCYAFIKSYNKYMWGTDTQDRLRLATGSERVRRADKQWVKLFLGLLDTAVANTTIVYKGLLMQRVDSLGDEISIPSRQKMIEKLFLSSSCKVDGAIIEKKCSLMPITRSSVDIYHRIEVLSDAHHPQFRGHYG
eukprot:g69501.t1